MTRLRLMRHLLIYVCHFILFTVFVPYVMYVLALFIESLTKASSVGYAAVIHALGWFLVALGLLIMLRAEIDMYRHGDGTPFPFYNPPKRLVREGIYACTRNPMYLGTTLEYCGLGLVLDRLLMIPIALITLGLAMTLYFKHEKPKLERLTGHEARAYFSSTPILIPRAKCLKHAILSRRVSKTKPDSQEVASVSRG